MKQLFFCLTLWLVAAHPIQCQRIEKFELVMHNNLLYVDQAMVENDSLQRLNLVLPSSKKGFPLLIWIGGGAWSYGDRNQEMNFAQKLGENGIAVASIGHRLSPAIWRDSSLSAGIQHPKHIEDVASAVKWLYDHADEYGYDSSNFFIGGYSSGGHLAALISLDARYLNKHGLSPVLFKGVIPISGTYDLGNYYQVLANGARPELAELHVKAVFGPTMDDLVNASPSNYLKGLSVPMLLMCDNNLYNYTKLFEEQIRETEFRKVQVVYSYQFSHGELWRNLSFSESSLYRNIIIDFIQNF